MSNFIPADEAIQQIAAFLNPNVAEGDAAQNTIRAYLGHIQQFVDWCGGVGVSPGQAGKQDLMQYRRWLAEQGYERSTIGAKLAALRRFFEAAQAGGYRADNPAAGLKPPRSKTTRRDQILKRYLSRAEIERVLAVPDARAVEGLRDKTILNHALFLSFSPPTYGQRLSINGVRFVVNQAEKAAGVYRTGVSCHAWRHAAATHSVSMGASIVAVSQMLGHADIKTTSVYTHVADAEAENPAAYLEQNLGGKDGD